jgi:hypothetical protein
VDDANCIAQVFVAHDFSFTFFFPCIQM